MIVTRAIRGRTADRHERLHRDGFSPAWPRSGAGARRLPRCSRTTYGTGTSPGMQTVEDLAGIPRSRRPEEGADRLRAAPADRRAAGRRALPPPGSGTATRSPPNWPNDPDEQAQEAASADAAAREAAGASDPVFRLPARPNTGSRTELDAGTDADNDHAGADGGQPRSSSPTRAARSPSTRTASRSAAT